MVYKYNQIYRKFTAYKMPLFDHFMVGKQLPVVSCTESHRAQNKHKRCNPFGSTLKYNENGCKSNTSKMLRNIQKAETVQKTNERKIKRQTFNQLQHMKYTRTTHSFIAKYNHCMHVTSENCMTLFIHSWCSFIKKKYYDTCCADSVRFDSIRIDWIWFDFQCILVDQYWQPFSGSIQHTVSYYVRHLFTSNDVASPIYKKKENEKPSSAHQIFIAIFGIKSRNFNKIFLIWWIPSSSMEFCLCRRE